MEHSGTLAQIGDPGARVDRVSQKELALILGDLQRETVTKRISLFAPRVPEWWEADALCECRHCLNLQAQGLARKHPRQCQSDKISAIAANHPHWKKDQSSGPAVTVARDCRRTKDERRARKHVAAILARNQGFRVANSYALSCKDGNRPSIGAGANQVGFLAHTFGAHLFSREKQTWLDPRQSLDGFRKSYGWIWDPHLPDAKDCTCLLQMKLKFQKEKADGRILDEGNSGDLRPAGAEPSLNGGNKNQQLHDASTSGSSVAAIQRSSQAGENDPHRPQIDPECPKCGGAGFVIEGSMPDYGRQLLHWLLDRGIDEEFRRCGKCKKNFAGNQMCAGCGSRGEVYKKRSELSGDLFGYTQEEIAAANGMNVSTVRRYFTTFKRLLLVRTVPGEVWRKCLKCTNLPLYTGKCPGCGSTSDPIKRRDKQLIIWLTSRTLDKQLAATERQRLDSLVKWHKLWLDQKHQADLESAVELAKKVLGEWEGGEHLLLSFHHEMRRRLAASKLRANLMNVLFPLQRE